MQRLILSIYEYLRPRRWLVWLSLAVILSGCVLSAFNLRLEEDICEFLPDTEDTERYSFFTDHYRIANEIVVNIGMRDSVSLTDTDLIETVVDELCDSLDNGLICRHINKVIGTVSPADVSSISASTASMMPYYLDSADYTPIEEKIKPEAIREQMERDRQMLEGVPGSVMKKVMMTDPLFLSAECLKGLSGFRYSDSYELCDGYIFTSDGKEAVVTLESAYPSSETKGNKLLIEELDRICACIAAGHPEIHISPFGAAYIAVSNADRIKRDSTMAIAASIVLILLILTIAYHNIKVLLALGATLLFGMIFSLGICGLCDNNISVIALGLGSVIIGIAANYPLHYLDHRYQGYGDGQTIRDISRPLTIGNITTVGAFASLLFISSEAMHDFGLFASMILVGTILFVLVFLPHILRLKSIPEPQRKLLLFSGMGRLRPERNGWVILTVVVLTVIFSITGRDTGFNADMNRINYMTPYQKERMAKLAAQQNSSNEILYVISDANTLDAALEAYEHASVTLNRLMKDSLVESVSGISDYLPSRKLQKERTEIWNRFWRERGEGTADLVDEYSEKAGFREGAFDRFRDMVNAEYAPVDADAFGPIKTMLADNYIITTEDRCMILTPVQVKKENLNRARELLSGQLDCSSFCFSHGSMVGETVDALSGDFDFVLWICGLLVFVFLLLTFRSAELSVIAFIPLAVSWIWILGIMGVFGLEFNIVNIILATFIFGMGDDYTIFITEGCIEENRTGRHILDTFKNTVMLSAVIIFAGIGVLVFAKHPSLNQLGVVTIIGMVCVVVMAYIIPPCLFRLLTFKKGRKRTCPVTFANFGRTVFVFSGMMAGTAFLALTGFVLLTVMGKTKAHKKLYHRIIWRLSRFSVNHIPGTHYAVNNPTVPETPCVIVANHQSHLDLLAVLSISPDIVVLTNRWVQRFPFYAALVRYADFLPVEGFASGRVPAALKHLVEDGYSVAIFPEGTRSEDGRIGRFHKGAAAIAESLNLDVLPVVLHGFSDVLPKADLLLRKGAMSMTVLPPVPAAEVKAVVTESEMGLLMLSRRIRQLMVEELGKIKRKEESVSYFTERVAALYLYRGGKLYYEVRKFLKDRELCCNFVDDLPYGGEVVITEPHLGEVTLLAAYTRPELKVVSKVSDECRVILSNLAELPENVVMEPICQN